MWTKKSGEWKLADCPETHAAEDPHDLRRFTRTQATHHSQALEEIREGRKRSCWMWYVIPTPPFIKNSVELGSGINRKYAIRSEEEARAYLTFEEDSVNLRQHYLEIMAAIREQLDAGITLQELIGVLDAPKLVSSVRFFEKLGCVAEDNQLRSVCGAVLQLLQAPPVGEEQLLFPEQARPGPSGATSPRAWQMSQLRRGGSGASSSSSSTGIGVTLTRRRIRSRISKLGKFGARSWRRRKAILSAARAHGEGSRHRPSGLSDLEDADLGPRPKKEEPPSPVLAAVEATGEAAPIKRLLCASAGASEGGGS